MHSSAGKKMSGEEFEIKTEHIFIVEDWRLTAEKLGNSKPAQRQKIERYQQWWNQGGLFCFWGVKFC